jgi:hypothetical protein
LNGDLVVSGQEAGPDESEVEAEALGTRLAERLLAEGGAAILTEIRSTVVPVVTEP